MKGTLLRVQSFKHTGTVPSDRYINKAMLALRKHREVLPCTTNKTRNYEEEQTLNQYLLHLNSLLISFVCNHAFLLLHRYHCQNHSLYDRFCQQTRITRTSANY